MSDRTCETCRWWKELAFSGQCRISPPAAWLGGEVRHSGDSLAVWPKTYREDWCGKHASKASRPAEPRASDYPGIV